MRTLYLTRHAKSSWEDPRTDDFNRPLNERGERDAPHMAKVFAQRGELVDLIVSSPAVRALTTARIFAKALASDENLIKQDKRIYLAPAENLLHLVNLLPNEAMHVMIFGHNPGFTDLIHYLGDGDVGDLPTCSTVRLDFTIDTWGEVSRGLGTLVWFDHPKGHPELA
jgi:phosphohistidine phosphatase